MPSVSVDSDSPHSLPAGGLCISLSPPSPITAEERALGSFTMKARLFYKPLWHQAPSRNSDQFEVLACTVPPCRPPKGAIVCARTGNIVSKQASIDNADGSQRCPSYYVLAETYTSCIEHAMASASSLRLVRPSTTRSLAALKMLCALFPALLAGHLCVRDDAYSDWYFDKLWHSSRSLFLCCLFFIALKVIQTLMWEEHILHSPRP
jgi:hypothetical protein